MCISDQSSFKAGMRRLAAGISIITTSENGRPYGLAATAVSSVSAEPRPTLLVCINRSASAHDHLEASGNFCVNVLAESDREIAAAFSSNNRAGRFASPRWTALKTGSPALEGALVSFDCNLVQQVSVGSHTIFIGEVAAVAMSSRAAGPLVYLDGDFRSVGPTDLSPAESME